MLFSRSPYRALVIGASGGIGAAVADALTADAACESVATLSRRTDGFDVLDENAVATAADQFARQRQRFDLIFNTVGALEFNGAGPEKAFKEIDPETMGRAFALNAVGSALVFKHFLPLLRGKGPAFMATLSARVGSIGDNRLGGWMSYRASKAALNQIVRCAAIETARKNKEAIVVALHPGTVNTPLTKNYARGRDTLAPNVAAEKLLRVLGELTPAESGGFFDYAGKEIPW